MRLLLTMVTAFAMSFAILAQDKVPYELTQAGMNEAAVKSCKASEEEMTNVLNALIQVAKRNPKAVSIIKSSQEAWQRYLEAQLKAKWPFPESSHYGSVMPMCMTQEKERLVKVRTQELLAMLHPQEGDNCGSQWPE